jgi:putative hydrolase of the HAD superfamily
LRESAWRRAIVFDLDDTLYPYRAFVRSGFRVVACRLAAERRLRPADVLRVLRRALAGGRRGQELQELCARFELPVALVGLLAELIREHTPSIRLPRESAAVLRRLRANWKVGVLTNGEPPVQRRKVAALGLDGLVDAVVYATECGDGAGKPASSAFHAALDRLNVEAPSTVFVGDDPRTDIEGAAAIGMKTIHMTSYFGHDQRCGAASCRIHVHRLSLIPAIADQLVPLRTESHVA